MSPLIPELLYILNSVKDVRPASELRAPNTSTAFGIEMDDTPEREANDCILPSAFIYGSSTLLRLSSDSNFDRLSFFKETV